MSADTVIVRIPEETRESLRSIAKAAGTTMREVLVHLVAEAENRLFFKEMALGYAEIEQDPDAQEVEQELMDRLDSDIMDGLGDTHDGRKVKTKAKTKTKSKSRRTMAC